MATSCKQGDGGQALNSEQQQLYDAFIDAQFSACSMAEVPAVSVALAVENSNSVTKLKSFIIEDTQAGKPIAGGTSKKDFT